jgi:hypothetical protein
MLNDQNGLAEREPALSPRSTAPHPLVNDSSAVPERGGQRRVLSRRLRSTAVSAIGNLLLLIASATLTALVGEGLVRWLAPQQLVTRRIDIFTPVDTLGWEHRPNVHTLINTGERTVHFDTDADGFRVSHAGPVVANDRILLIGDSFMAAAQVEYDSSLAGLLQSRLPVRLGKPIEVQNAAVTAWDPPQYYYRARRMLEHRHYDLVLVSIFLGNDINARGVAPLKPRAEAEIHSFRWPRNLSKREIINAVFYPINDHLTEDSELFVLLKKKAQLLLMRAGLTALYFPDDFLKSEAKSPRWEMTADICAQIADLAKKQNVPVLFFLVPTDFQVNQSTFRQYVHGFHIDPSTVDIDQPNRLFGAALKERGLHFIDALPAFREIRNVRPLYGSVDPHFSAAGHNALERLIEPSVVADIQSATNHQ